MPPPPVVFSFGNVKSLLCRAEININCLVIGHGPVRVKARQLATLPPGNSEGNSQEGMQSGASFGSGHRRHETLPKMDGVRNHFSDCFYKVVLISVKKG